MNTLLNRTFGVPCTSCSRPVHGFVPTDWKRPLDCDECGSAVQPDQALAAILVPLVGYSVGQTYGSPAIPCIYCGAGVGGFDVDDGWQDRTLTCDRCRLTIDGPEAFAAVLHRTLRALRVRYDDLNRAARYDTPTGWPAVMGYVWDLLREGVADDGAWLHVYRRDPGIFADATLADGSPEHLEAVERYRQQAAEVGDTVFSGSRSDPSVTIRIA